MYRRRADVVQKRNRKADEREAAAGITRAHPDRDRGRPAPRPWKNVYPLPAPLKLRTSTMLSANMIGGLDGGSEPLPSTVSHFGSGPLHAARHPADCEHERNVWRKIQLSASGRLCGPPATAVENSGHTRLLCNSSSCGLPGFHLANWSYSAAFNRPDWAGHQP